MLYIFSCKVSYQERGLGECDRAASMATHNNALMLTAALAERTMR